MSGGMRQRVMIAMALSCNPVLLIADEPTTALDVTIQAQILELMERLQEDVGASILFITHDLGVVAEMSDHVAVMYAGKVVEYADVVTLYEQPRHPYTLGLFDSLPDLHSKGTRLNVIPGVVPSPVDFPSGCRFRNRCPHADARCANEEPRLRHVGAGHTVACHAVEEGRIDRAERGPVYSPDEVSMATPARPEGDLFVGDPTVDEAPTQMHDISAIVRGLGLEQT
jgi:peptide/nickel transport system ATP-binding protein/oligopeptide transport system ATP-binding protein